MTTAEIEQIISWSVSRASSATLDSLVSIRLAAGAALMGQAKGNYAFFGHLKWLWANALGYAAGILTHMWINMDRFQLTA